ncbi:hypothetical protein [Streptomyces sp. NPDC048172]|uniref:hypothetical protein n=1 Tax=Streptomyces sp. NPDC048172 TaxID=3365505 RepID=UPI0037224343
MTRSTALWFVFVLVLTTPILLATYRGDDGLTGTVWLTSLGTAAAISAITALAWGKKKGAR